MSAITDPAVIDPERLQALRTFVKDPSWTCSVCLAGVITQPESQSYTGVALRAIGATACPSGEGGSIHSHFFHVECAKYVFDSMGNKCPICKAPDVLKPIFNPIFRDSTHGLPVPHCLDKVTISEKLKQGKFDLSQDESGKTPFHRAVYYNHLPYLTALATHWKAGMEFRDAKSASALDCAVANGRTDCIAILINAGCEVNSSGDNQKTPLINAVRRKRLDSAAALLKSEQIEVDKPSKTGKTPLYVAACNNNLPMMALLTAHGASPACPCSDKMTPLHAAIKEKHPDAAALLIATQKAAVDARDAKGRTALYIASSLGDTKTMLLLFAHKASVKQPDNNGKTPLHLAASIGRTKAAKLLLENGAQANDLDHNDCSALYFAAFSGHHEIVSLLLDSDAEVNQRDKNFNTPFLAATYSNKIQVMELLAKRGAALDARDNHRLTAFHFAAHEGHVDASKLLLKLKVDPKLVDNTGQTSLHVAAGKGHLEVTNLLKVLVPIDSTDKKGETPLHFASRTGYKEVIASLLDSKAEINSLSSSRKTPLFFAARAGKRSATKLLLDRGATVDEEDINGDTPLIAAVRNGHHEVVSSLLDFGADPKHFNKAQKTALSLATDNQDQKCVDLLKGQIEERKRAAEGALGKETTKKRK